VKSARSQSIRTVNVVLIENIKVQKSIPIQRYTAQESNLHSDNEKWKNEIENNINCYDNREREREKTEI
jgi:hypothetical protein